MAKKTRKPQRKTRKKKSGKLNLIIVLVVLIAAVFLLWRYLKPGILNNPESVVFDSVNNRFLISNTGNGRIISMDENGHLKVFLKEGLKNPRGMIFSSPYLFVADNTNVHAIDVQAEKIVYSIAVEGAKQLNDIAADHKGLLYVTDTQANRLYIIEPASKKVEHIEAPELVSPNGLVYDAPRRDMIIVSFRKSSPLLLFNVESRQFRTFKETIFDNLDGIAIDDLGRIYFSSWGEQAIYQIPQEQNQFFLFKTDLPSPADIYYHEPTHELIVPLFEKNRIERISLP